MIDPQNITKYDRTQEELEELALFAICVAGKRADLTAQKVDAFLKLLNQKHPGVKPFRAIYQEGRQGVYGLLQQVRMGQYNRISDAFMAVSNVDMKCTGVVWLESAIGPKTARFILLHSRPNQRYAVLDTHILAWMRDQGVKTPKSTPPAGDRYNQLEQEFLRLIGNRDVAEVDLEIWRSKRKSK